MAIHDNQNNDMDMITWLVSPKTKSLFHQIARSLIRAMRSGRLSHRFLSESVFDDQSLEDNLVQELALFIIENRRGIQERLSYAGERAGMVLRQTFFQYWQDKTRSPLVDPQRNFYKHTADVLRESKRFFIIADKKKSTAFSMNENSRAVPPLAEEDLTEISFPTDLAPGLDYEIINRKKVILELAEHFWREASRLWNEPSIRLDLRDFVQWIRCHVVMTPPVSHSDLSVQEESQAPEPVFDEGKIKIWAGCAAACLNENEREALFSRYKLENKLSQIAEKLNYRSPASVKYLLSNAEEKLRYFLRDLPWLSPDDFVDEAWDIFFEELLSVLKESTLET